MLQWQYAITPDAAMTLALVAAMAIELEPARKAARAVEDSRPLGQAVYCGRIGAHDVVLAETGMGKVRAAAVTQALIERYGISRLIMFGSAGAVNPKHDVGTIIVGRQLIQHDFSLFSGRAMLGWGRDWVPADKRLSAQLLAAGKRLGLPVAPGRIVTGDQPVAHDETRQRLWSEFRADCVEMEGAAVAMVCHLNGVPFAIARGLTDRADAQAVRAFRRRIRDVSKQVAGLAVECVRGL
ncbi:MAG: 5'-methylthioadenosine/S-adenosylhomocysteine nucleosidase [Chloroflexi bacterium]|nr:5'-methylthioadenosine/S-adenosylhomocysteine nucleosidase [Chloroflexota bacterium]